MEFEPSPRARELSDRLRTFLSEHLDPIEDEVVSTPHVPTVEEPWPAPVARLRRLAREAGLWNLFLPDSELGAGLSNADYAPLCEIMGRSLVAPFVFNCNAPDTGNMEILAEFGSPEQQAEFLRPLLDGEARSCFAMTEPDVSGSDPTGLETRAVRDGDHYVVTGHKWFATGATGARFSIVMAITDPEGPPHARATQIIVPLDAPGVNVVRPISVMGHTDGPGHCEIRYESCRVPVSHRLGEEGSGFAIAQARLGPGRIHHCMRAIGAAERALELMCRRANDRVAFGGPLAEKQFVQDFVARSRMEIDQARLLCLHAAWKMDVLGKKEARQEISMIKVVAANVCMDVLDRAIQVFGAKGVSDDTPLARMWRDLRMLRLADGPDEVHKMVIARRELARYR